MELISFYSFLQSDYEADYGRHARHATKTTSVKKRSGSKKRSKDEGGVFIKRNVTTEKRGSRYHRIV